MISMTTYWQQFKECVDNLQLLVKNAECSRQIEVAHDLIEIGLTIEQLGITEMKQVTHKLWEKAKSFNHEVRYTEGRDYTFYLPQINNTESLIFAIIYYRHLNNYQNVAYQGSITWFKQKVIDGINEKKITTAFQAKALLQEIRNYCQKLALTPNESLFLKTETESVKDYTGRIVKVFIKPEDQGCVEKKTIIQSDKIANFEKSLKKLQTKSNQLEVKIDSLKKKLSSLNKATEEYFKLTKEWQNKGIITRSFYWFISHFFEVSLFKNLKKAEQQMLTAKNELQQELLLHTPEIYIEKLQELQQELMRKQIEIQSKITQTKEAPEAEAENTPNAPIICIPHQTSVKTEVREEHLGTSSNNDNYGFFKKNIPSKYTLQAIAVGITAVAIQNLLS